MIKKLVLGFIICGCYTISSMENPSSKSGISFYRVSSQLHDLRNSEETNPKYDNENWLKLKDDLNKDENETFITNKDLSEEEIERLESETNYKKKAEAFEKAFFGNTFLYEKFCELVQASGNPEDLADMHSEFLRWIVNRQKGNYEKAKSLVWLYKSLKDYGMYALWKSIAVFLNLPVERM